MLRRIRGVKTSGYMSLILDEGIRNDHRGRKSSHFQPVFFMVTLFAGESIRDGFNLGSVLDVG